MNKRYIGYIETARLFEDGYAWKFEVKIKTRYKDFFAYFTVEQFPDFARVLQISEGKEIRQQTVRIEVNKMLKTENQCVDCEKSTYPCMGKDICPRANVIVAYCDVCNDYANYEWKGNHYCDDCLISTLELNFEEQEFEERKKLLGSVDVETDGYASEELNNIFSSFDLSDKIMILGLDEEIKRGV